MSREQVRAHRVSRDVVASQLARGAWVRYRGVLRLREVPDSAESRAWAALLRGGPGTELTGTSALRALGFDVPAPVPTIHVPRDRHIVAPGALVLRELREPSPLRFGPSFRLASEARAAVDALRTLPYDDALDVLDRLQGADRPVRLWAAEWLDDHRGYRGARQVRRVLGATGDPARSRAERRLHGILRRARIARWRANVPVYDDAGMIGIADVLFDDVPLVLELDGREWHSGRDRFQRDRRRQNRMVRLGLTVLHFTWWDVEDRPQELLRTVRETHDRLRRAA